MRKYLCLVFLINITFIFAQTPFKVNGVVKDSLSKAPLISLTVYLERLKDSTMVSYSITDQNGCFEIEAFNHDSILNLNISYTGMQTYTKKSTSINRLLQLELFF